MGQLVIETINTSLIMKRYLIIPILLTLLLASCDDRANVTRDYDDPRISFPNKGVAFNTAWMLDENVDYIDYQVNLSGVRPENQKSNITVTFSIKQSLIDDYNAGTNTYSGQLQALPANCYEIEGTTAVIPSGSNSGPLPIKIHTDLVDALPKLDGGGDPIYYTIPIFLESTSKYKLVDDVTRREALAVIQVDNPRFYFWDNRNGRIPIGRRLVYGSTPMVENFKVTSYGLDNDQAYTLTFSVDPAELPSGGVILPADAYELPSTTVEIPEGAFDAPFPVKILPDNIPFLQTFYLPIKIVSVSKYSGDAVKGTLLLAVTVKNDYEWAYTSKLTSFLTQANRSANYTDSKSPVSVDAETIRIQMSINNTNANNSDPNFLPLTGWTSTGWTGNNSIGFTHVPGNTDVLSHPNPARVGFGYSVAYTITGPTAGAAGTFVVAFGGSTTAAVSASGTLNVTSATTAANLTITPSSTCNRTIRVTITALNSFNGKFYRLKVIPNPGNNRDWGVELIRITDEGAANSPVDLELTPTKHSYYDWDYEKFVLYYRWKDASGSWIEVTEILEAQF